MRTRFSTAAGFLAAATLLSSSAFAFAPEFDADLPTVIITDRLQAPVPATDPFDPGVATTQHLYRYTAAFDLLDYIQLGPTGVEVDPDDVRFLFNEFPNVDPIPSEPNLRDQGTLLINGERAFATAGSLWPGQADFATAPLVTSRYGSGDGRLDFRNRDLSGDDESDLGPFPGIGMVTGDDFTISGVQERVVQMYISTDEADDMDYQNFVVITATDPEGDRLVDLVTPPITPPITPPFDPVFEPVYTQDDFGSWEPEGLGQLVTIPESGTFDDADTIGAGNAQIGGFAATPFINDTAQANTPIFVSGSAGSPTKAPAGTTSVRLTGTNAQMGFAGWSLKPDDMETQLEANRLYQLRARMNRLDDNRLDQIRVRLGNVFQTGEVIGGYLDGSDVTNVPAGKVVPHFSTQPEDFFLHLIPKGDGPAQIAIELLSVNQARGNDFRVHEVELGVADRADLGEGTVIKNIGGPVPTPWGNEADFTPVPPNQDQFDVTSNVVGSRIRVNSPGINADQPANLTTTANVLTIVSQQDANQDDGRIMPDFFGFGFQDSGTFDLDAEELFPVQEGKVYIVDVWVSTTTPNNLGKPQLRLRAEAARTYQAAANFALTLEDVFGEENQARVVGQPRAYSTVMMPQLSGNQDGWAKLDVEFLYMIQKATQSNTIRIHRIVVTEYDAPVAD